MMHPEGQPLPDNTKGLITEAEIALLQVNLDNIDAERTRRERLLEVEALDPATIEFVTHILTQTAKEAHATDKTSS